MIDPTRPGDPASKPSSPVATKAERPTSSVGADAASRTERDQDTVEIELAADLVEIANTETRRVNAERLSALKAAYADGTYTVDADALADRILDDAGR